MKIALIILRSLETLFLVGFVATLTITPNGTSTNFSFISVFCNFSINSGQDQIVLSSVIVGYLFSLCATGQQWGHAKPKLLWWSFGLALLGFCSTGNEFLRYFIGHDFRLWLNFPAIVIVIDWVMTVQHLKREAANRVDADELA